MTVKQMCHNSNIRAFKLLSSFFYVNKHLFNKSDNAQHNGEFDYRNAPQHQMYYPGNGKHPYLDMAYSSEDLSNYCQLVTDRYF